MERTFNIGDRVYVYNPSGWNGYVGTVIVKVPPNTYPGNHSVDSRVLSHLTKKYRKDVKYSHETYLIQIEGTTTVTRPRLSSIGLTEGQSSPKKKATKTKSPAPLKVPFVVKKTPAPVSSLAYAIHYNLTQLEAAAEFIFKNNDLVARWLEQPKSVADVQQIIAEFIRRQVRANMIKIEAGNSKSWTDWASTGGYTILMTTDDDYTVDVEIVVDPAVGNKHNPWRAVSESFSETLTPSK